MRRPALRFRLFFAFLAMVQVAAPPAAALADAAFARDARWIGVHVESKSGGRRDHPPHRDNCFFCQFLGQHAVASQPGIRERVAVLVTCSTVEQSGQPGHTVGRHLPDWRAPPVA